MQLCYHSYGGKALLIGGYRYLAIRKEKDGKEFWRCFNQLCTPIDDIVKDVRDHNHVPNSARNRAEIIVARMKKKAREEVETVPHIYMDTLNDIVSDAEQYAIYYSLAQPM